MSQHARNNPEAYEQGIDWLDAHSDLADREKQRERLRDVFDGKGICPRCEAEGIPHKPGCVYFVAED